MRRSSKQHVDVWFPHRCLGNTIEVTGRLDSGYEKRYLLPCTIRGESFLRKIKAWEGNGLRWKRCNCRSIAGISNASCTPPYNAFYALAPLLYNILSSQRRVHPSLCDQSEASTSTQLFVKILSAIRRLPSESCIIHKLSRCSP